MVISGWGVGGTVGATVLLWVEARDVAKHPPMHRTAPTTKTSPIQNVSSAQVEKTYSVKS